MYHKPSVTAAGTSTSAFSDFSQDADLPVIQGVDPDEEVQQPAVVGGQDAPSGKPATKTDAAAHRHKKGDTQPDKKGKKKKKPGHAKKIGTVVSAEKDKKFNPKTKVRGWLDEWGPEPETQPEPSGE